MIDRTPGLLFTLPTLRAPMEQKRGSKIAHEIYIQTSCCLARTLLLHSRTVSIIWGQLSFNMSLSGLQFSPADLAYQSAHIHEDKRPSTVAAVAVLSVLSTMAVTLKLGIRWRMRAGFKEDDYTIILALVDIHPQIFIPCFHLLNSKQVFGWINFITCLYGRTHC